MADGFISNENGNIKISEEVVVRIGAIAAREVEGVAALGAPSASFSELWGKKNQTKGVKAELTDGSAETDIHISVRLGYKICEVARKVQESVRFALESYVGLTGVTVNVFVDAICADKADAEKLAAEDPEEAPAQAAQENKQ